MKSFFCGFFLLLISSTLIEALTDAGVAYLTPDIEQNKIFEARCKSKVIHPVLEGYSGLLTVNKTFNSNIFFWFIEAKRNPRSSPVGLWLQGGPGFSCFYGIFMENGPYTFEGNSTTLQNRNYSWTNFMNMIYVDNPVGTGFSFTNDPNGYAKYQSDIVDNLLTVLEQFFKLFPEYCENDLYLIGESYGAKYAITLAEAIRNNVRRSLKVKLQGVLLESGVVDPTAIDIPSLALQTSLVDDNGYQALQAYQTLGLSYVEQGDFTNAAFFGSFALLGKLFELSGLSQQFNYLADAIPFSEQIVPFLERNDVRKALHVGNLTLSNLLGTNTVFSNLIDDLLRSVKDKLPALFAEYRFLIYSGQLDIIAPAPSVETYLNSINFANYTSAQRKPYFDGAHLAGWIKEAANTSRVTVRDAGFSDPYCMLGIQPAGAPISPQPPLTPRTLSDVGFDNNLDSPHHDKLRKHHSFRLSFKRKDGGRREQRDSLGGGPVPAKFIRATSIKPHTLSPKWNEKFKLDIDDINNDTFHLDIWDHDDESCVLDAVSRLNEVRGVRGLGRFFKQVCQSARQGSQDDFLGCVNIPIADIPSTGLEGWFKLEARSQRSSVQGRIRLKLWLSTRDDRGFSEEDNSLEVRKLARLQKVVMSHEVAKHEPSWTWPGDLPGPAMTIFHQMAVQGNLSDLQCALARFVAVVHVNRLTPIDPKFIHRLLVDIDKLWNQPSQEPLTRELEQWLAEAMNGFVDKSLNQIRRHRDIFPALHPPSLHRLEFLLRCLGLLGSMKAFRQVCPFNKGVRGEIVGALRKGSVQWAQFYLRESQRSQNSMVCFTTTLVANLQLGLSYYHSVFDTTNGIQYFSIIYKQFDAILADEVTSRMETGQVLGTTLTQCTVLEGDKEPPDIRPFELYLVLQEFTSLKQHLSVMPQPPEKPLALQNYHEWFEPAIQRWIMVSKAKALQRVRAAIMLDRICEGDRIVRHSTSSVDTVSCFYQMREFWKIIAWPDSNSYTYFEAQLIESACAAAMHYGDLIHQALADGGYYEQSGPFRTSDEMCVTVNNVEYVRRGLSEFRPDTHNPHESAEALLETSLTQLETRAERVLSKLAPSMQVPLQKAVFHLAWSPDSLPTNQAIVPLLEYLDVHLSALNSALLTKNFNRALTLIWNTVLCELSRQMDTGGEGERPTNFHDRLYEALQLLVDFFNAEGLGLPTEILQNDSFWRVEQRLQYHKKETDKLMDLFYMQRLQDQLMASPGQYGVLAVRAYFNHDSLCVEVLHARDIIPLDPNGFSDPFVIVELLPRKVFMHCAEQQTNVHKKTLNPNFDECFEFSVSLEQCSSESSMICFTVMDHDVLTANDFAGEAFLALGTIPGVADYNTSVDNFHGLKQVELPLMQQTEKNHPILQILESRIGDKQAVDFVRKQRARLVN